jgi:hypothetical protein
MIRIQRETHQYVQSGVSFPLWIFSADGRGFFATEEIGHILVSADTLAEDDATVVLEWDRNSMESPDLGPRIEDPIPSHLFLHRIGAEIHFEEGHGHVRSPVHRIPFAEWKTTVMSLKAERLLE